MKSMKAIAGLLVTTALGSSLCVQAAHAQQANNNPSADAGTLLGDVVVTATRQTSTANKVALSISAVTQKTLDQQGIKNVTDLQRTVPALTVTNPAGSVFSTFTIRGIQGTGATASTTGVYLDDIPLQKRATNGVSQNNGTPAPPLFDLDRVEVLRGPQGTLFGGSSEGGTVRFISPSPSLSTYSVAARTEIAETEYGAPSYEGGLALGGPIIKDKLAFRITGYEHHDGGYIDLVDPLNPNNVLFKDANWSDVRSIRAALRFEPNDKFRADLSIFSTVTNVGDTGSAFLKPVNHTLTEPQECYNPVPSNFVYASSSITPNICGSAPNQYVKPALTYGPFNFKPYQNLAANTASTNNPADSFFTAPSLALEYKLPHVAVRSVTSYILDGADSINYEAPQVSNTAGFVDKNGNYYQPGSSAAFTGTTANLATGATLFSPFENYEGQFISHNRRFGLVQELRFSSTDDPKPLSWVGGIYYSAINEHTSYRLPEDLDQIAEAEFNIPAIQRYSQRVALGAGQTCASLGLPASQPVQNVAGACLVGLPALPGGIETQRDQRSLETEIAGYGEVNYWLTSKFKVNLGFRYSMDDLTYTQVFDGPGSGFNVPTVANTGITNGNTKSDPLTPKFGIQYQLTDRDLVYANAAKGYRPGGVNVPLPVAICGPGLALIGLTVADAPATFGPDSVWSYEAGGKFRIADRIQINASAYKIDWSNVQLAVTIPGCGPNFLQNAGQAVSQGADLQIQGRVFEGLTVDLSMGYDDAHFTTTATGPKPTNGSAATPVVSAGDELPVPPWTVSLGATYNFSVWNGKSGFLRADFQYASAYYGSFGPGVNAYAPDSRDLPATRITNLRAGLTFNRNIDASLYVNNLFGSEDALALSGGRGGCTPNTDASCATFTSFTPFVGISSFRPRTVGLQVNYKY